MNSLSYHTFPAPFGTVYLYACDEFLRAVLFKPWGKCGDDVALNEDNVILQRAQNQLEDYFLGKRTTFDLPLKVQSTDFQKRVWDHLITIPFGETQSYGEMAKALGNPTASRAVGMANGKNPLSIIVPCHRVIGANGSLTGYAGGLEAKKWLLEHEQRVSKSQ